MDKKEFSKELFRPIKIILAVIIIISILGIMSSPFIWIWYDLGLAIKVGASSILLNIFSFFFVSLVSNISDKVSKETIDNPNKQSKFQEKLQKLMKERENI